MKTKVALLCLLSAAYGVAHAETYALIIGINDYPQPMGADGKPVKGDDGNPINNDLKGAVNDAKVYKDLLTGKYGVKEANVKSLLDKQADEAGFVREMKWLIQTPKQGDQIIFVFSGHGTQYAGGDEADGKEEGIVLSDGKLVPDNLFGDVKTLMSKAGVNATYLFDSCFSGGMSREGWKTKAIEGAAWGKNYKALPLSRFNPTINTIKMRQVAAPVTPGEFAFIFASQEGVPSIDFPGTEDLPAHGLFTLALTAVLNEDPVFPARDLVDGVAVFFEETFKDKKEIEQRPQSEYSSASRSRLPVFLR